MFVTSPDPFVPTPDALIDAKLQLASVQPDELIYDLGCGDARVLIRAAQQFGAKAVGVDIREELVRQARQRVSELKLDDRIEVSCGDYLELDVSSADVVMLYLSRGSLGQISLKLEQELKPGARIVTHSFDLPAWKPTEERSITLANGSDMQLYLYTVK